MNKPINIEQNKSGYPQIDPLSCEKSRKFLRKSEQLEQVNPLFENCEI